MALKLDEIIAHAREYVELEAKTKVLNIKFEKKYRLIGKEDIVLTVNTNDKDTPDWWVIGGSTPMNLYSKSKYPTMDEAFSLHTGIMLRLAARDFKASKKAPKDIGYDAFISHASER